MTQHPPVPPTAPSTPQRTVRLAWAADVEAMAAIQLVALRERLPRELATELDAEQLAGAWRRAVSAPPTARHRVLVATEGTPDGPAAHGQDAANGEATLIAAADLGPALIAAADLGTTGSGNVVGFAATAPAEDPDAVPGTDGEVLALHTARDDDDELLGALLAAAADTLEADGFTRGQLWVGSSQDALRRVAEGAGWVPDGAHRRLDLPTEDSEGLAQVRLHTGLTGDELTGDGQAEDGQAEDGQTGDGQTGRDRPTGHGDDEVGRRTP